MTTAPDRVSDPRIREAVAELEERIRHRYPAAIFSVFQGFGDDTEEVYLQAVVDVEDTDEVLDLVIDRLVDMRVEEEIPINVHPRRWRDRLAASDLAPEESVAST